MSSFRSPQALFLLLLALPWGAGCSRSGVAGATALEGVAVEGPHPIRLEGGRVQPRHLLTGELVAARAVPVVVPRSPSFRVQIRWLEEDGAAVRRGQKVAELDNSAFVGEVEGQRLQVVEAENALLKARADAQAELAEKRFAVAQKEAELEKARLKAAVPEGLLPRREEQERRLAATRAEVELVKARAELAASEEAQRVAVEIRILELERARRELAVTEEAISALALTAPEDGVLQVGEHPWEQRKLQVGDNVWVGLPLVSIPDLSSLAVEASLSDVDEGRVRPGMEARVVPDAFPQLSLGGRVESVAPVAREGEGGTLLRFFTVRVDLEGAPDPLLRPGMSVKVAVLPPPEEGLVMPRGALDLTQDPPRARLADGRTVPVRLGGCDAHRCRVEEGLEAGQALAALAPVAGGGPSS
jgi:hypothetical protein